MKCLTRLLCVVLLGSCLMAQAADDVLFRVHGSNTVGAALAPACAREYLASIGVANPRVKRAAADNEYEVYGRQGNRTVTIQIAAHGSGTGFTALAEGRAEIAMSSRPIKREEALALRHLGNLRAPEAEQAVAIDGLAIIVHPDNPVAQLTVAQVARVFAGHINNWQQLGGPDLPISLYARDDKSGTWDTFSSLVLGKQWQLSPAARRFESNDQLSDQVSSDRSAIGFVGLASVRSARLLAIADSSTAAMQPTPFTVATEDYPLSRRLFFYVPQVSRSQAAAEYVAFCQSQQGQDIVKRVGFVSQTIIAFDQPAPATAPASYRKLAEHGRRLSVNFRFDQGSPQLDNKAWRDLSRIVDYMQLPENRNARLYLVGFSEAGEAVSQDLLLSRYRALAVRGALLRDNVPVAASIGLGSMMPVAANDRHDVRNKNGRVEVWQLDNLLVLDDIASR